MRSNILTLLLPASVKYWSLRSWNILHFIQEKKFRKSSHHPNISPTGLHFESLQPVQNIKTAILFTIYFGDVISESVNWGPPPKLCPRQVVSVVVCLYIKQHTVGRFKYVVYNS